MCTIFLDLESRGLQFGRDVDIVNECDILLEVGFCAIDTSITVKHGLEIGELKETSTFSMNMSLIYERTGSIM